MSPRKRIQRGHIHIVWPSGQSVKFSADEREMTPENMAHFAAICTATSEAMMAKYVAIYPPTPTTEAP